MKGLCLCVIRYEERKEFHFMGALRKIFEGLFGREAPEEALAHAARFWMPPEGF